MSAPAGIEMVFVYVTRGGEHRQWFTLPAVPRTGETVQMWVDTPGGPVSRTFHVSGVTWRGDDPNRESWYAEVSLVLEALI